MSTVGANKSAIQNYIKYQQDEDMMADRMTAKSMWALSRSDEA